MVKSVKSLYHMLSISQNECETYCRNQRLTRFSKQGASIHRLALHSLAHRILMPLLAADLFVKGKHLVIVGDHRIRTHRPVIYCPTHIGGVDIEMSFLAIQTPCWILMGDPRELYHSFDGFLLDVNGMIPMDVAEKEDRRVAKAQMEALLHKGGSLLMFAEGVQNISPNALVNPLFPGAVEMAASCDADLVPIALGREGNTYYANIGKNIRYGRRCKEDLKTCTDYLRDTMATLKWEILEQLPLQKRSKLSDTAYEDFVHAAFDLGTSYTWTVEDIQKGMYRPKGQTDPQEVFSFLERITPRSANAFLFHGQRL